MFPTPIHASVIRSLGGGVLSSPNTEEGTIISPDEAAATAEDLRKVLRDVFMDKNRCDGPPVNTKGSEW
jgi:hypothetical protein